MTRGVVFLHSAPAALCPHVEWALAGVLGTAVPVQWTPQPAQPGTYRAEVSWTGQTGTAARMASALRGWTHLRFEVTEEPSPGSEGERFCGTPALGIFHAVIGVHGDILVPEDRLRAAVLEAEDGGPPLGEALPQLLGQAWDDELEPFRHAGDGAPVRWLHQVI
ncbi:MAG: DUF3145 domain-containing protein [Actinomycetes bacterium]